MRPPSWKLSADSAGLAAGLREAVQQRPAEQEEAEEPLQAAVQEFLHDVVLSPHNVLLDYCEPETVRQLVERSRHHVLGDGVYSFLWVLMFTSGWLRQLPSGGERSLAAAPASRLQGVPGTA